MAGVEEHWTVGRVAELAGVSVRTLHHYDRIGLVRPSARTPAGYRAYRAGDMERLREVLAYRRLGFGLREVAELVDDPSADALAHLRRLRGLLRERRDLADAMVAAIDREIAARAEGVTVPPEEQLGLLGARLYDAIGGAYPATRRTEPRFAVQIGEALGDARTVVNVGAGTGSYEPAGREVTAVEPSAVMRAQRPAGAAPCVAAAAERLPFAGPRLRCRDGRLHRAPLGGPDGGAARDAARGPARGGADLRHRRAGMAGPVLAHPGLPARVRRRARGLPLAARDGRGDRRRPGRAGARPVGLRRRPLRGVLAPPRGIPGGACTQGGVGVDRGSGPRPSGGRCGASGTTCGPAGGPSATADLASLDAADLGLRLLVA